MLWEWRLTGLSDIAELLISELVTNAVQISRADGQTTPVRLWMLADRTRVLILVWDSSPLPPNTIELGGFSSAWLRDLAFYAGLEVKGDSR